MTPAQRTPRKAVKGPMRNCDECEWFMPFGHAAPPSLCGRGHVPRFYMPSGPMDQTWGYRHRCEDFTELPAARQRRGKA